LRVTRQDKVYIYTVLLFKRILNFTGQFEFGPTLDRNVFFGDIIDKERPPIAYLLREYHVAIWQRNLLG